MSRSISPRYFLLSVLLLLGLVGVYIFFEAQRFQDELLRQAEAKGLALADAMEANIRASVLANSLLEELIGQRLLDNARLIDELLQFPPTDEKALQQIAAANRLSKIELLDPNGRPLDALPAPSARRMQEMMSRMGKPPLDEPAEHRRAMMFMWGRRWRLPQEQANPPPKISEKKFWEGSAFGVAIAARSFSGIIAVHANADYILNFRKQIEVQRQVEELGRQSDIDHIALVDKDLNVLAETDLQRSQQRHDDPLLLQVRAHGGVGHGIVQRPDGTKHFDVVKPLNVNGSPFGFLEIGLSLQSMDSAWRRSLGSMAVVGLGILGVGILGMAAIFHNQRRHLQSVRALEEEIHRNERLSELGSLAATVAHEIRNPLNSISMGMQRLKAEFTPVQDAGEYSHFLTLMQNEVERLNRTVEQFLSLARPVQLSPEPIAVEEFIREVTTLLDAEARAANIRIDLDAGPNLPAVRGDRNHLKQLLLNLILNGIQAMPAGGRMSIRADRVKNRLELSVTDRGIGIKPDQLGKIFDPYFTTKANGSGLGLAIARRIAEAHGGKIDVQSEPGQGACFRVSLPLGNQA
ncbi:MAG TPA: ATP-binding protein [Phototrophicaceae bacterium]|nr:ATP-binding protein [Phototrophicaceae bacterium]